MGCNTNVFVNCPSSQSPDVPTGTSFHDIVQSNLYMSKTLFASSVMSMSSARSRIVSLVISKLGLWSSSR